MGVRIEPYQSGDVYKVKIRLGDPLGGPVRDMPELSWSLVDDDKNVLACVGILNEHNGIGTFVSFISDEAGPYGKMMIKFGRKLLNHALTELRFHRIQSIVRADKPEYLKFTELLGMKQEGLMRKATANGSDVWLYSRVIED